MNLVWFVLLLLMSRPRLATKWPAMVMKQTYLVTLFGAV